MTQYLGSLPGPRRLLHRQPPWVLLPERQLEPRWCGLVIKYNHSISPGIPIIIGVDVSPLTSGKVGDNYSNLHHADLLDTGGFLGILVCLCELRHSTTRFYGVDLLRTTQSALVATRTLGHNRHWAWLNG